MKSPFLVAAAVLALGLPGTVLANSTVAHLKGHTAVAAPAAKTETRTRGVCHPDPTKGRDCRHRNAQHEAKSAAPALADAAVVAGPRAH